MSNADAKKANLKELELNALLEVTEAINNNLPEESLYKIYHFTLLANLKVKRLALYVKSDEWSHKVSFGVKPELLQKIDVSSYSDLKKTYEIEEVDEVSRFFQNAIPVLHKGSLLAVVFVGGVSQGKDGGDETTFLEALTNILLVAIENKKLAHVQILQEALAKELEIAQHVQQNLFPKKLPETDKLEINAFYQPHHNVGGDYYDYIPIDEDQFIVCIADVSGKGVPAALMMSNFQASLRTLVRQTVDIEMIVKELNYQLVSSGNREIFITFFVALYSKSEKRLTYANCGHNIPYLLHDNKMTELDVGTTVLGMFEPLPFISTAAVSDLEEFLLFTYTDGLNEAVDVKDDEFGEDRIVEILEADSHSAKDVNIRMMNEVNSYRGTTPYRDDVTLLTVKVNK
ncbi:MAG: PP2C family protein-serine/threonine phosphatase [Reichenbachiella sp.]